MTIRPKSIVEPGRYTRIRQRALDHGFHNISAMHRRFNARNRTPVTFPAFYRVCVGQRRSRRIESWINKTLQEDIFPHD